MPDQPVELTEAEWAIIKSVWEHEPTTAPAIQEKLSKATGWTYSTVRTFMDRMVAKGLLRAKKDGKTTTFTSAVTRDEAQRGELLYALKHAFNGALLGPLPTRSSRGEEERSALKVFVGNARIGVIALQMEGELHSFTQ